MTDPNRDPPIEEQLLEEAATWFARMRGPDAEASREDFDAWLARGALHRRAYNRASEIFAMGKLLTGEHEEQPEAPASPKRMRRPTIALAVLGVAVVAGAGSLLLRPAFDGARRNQEIASGESGGQQGRRLFATRANEIRSVRLADGSLIKLQGGTTLAVVFNHSLRLLALEQGLARFQVVHESRPFVVQAGGGSVTARGTMFVVALTKDRRVAVKLIQGTIDVSIPVLDRAAQGRPLIRRLQSGESVSFDAARDGFPQAPATSGGSAKAAAAAPALMAVPDGARDFDNVRLADLIAEANRRAARKIQLATPTMGERRVSGRFRIDNPELLAERLSALFDLTVQRTAGSILLK